jgi:hypothetical protein
MGVNHLYERGVGLDDTRLGGIKGVGLKLD